MNKITKMLVGTLCAVMLVSSAFCAATNAVTTAKAPSDEAWVLTLNGLGSTATTGDKNTAVGVDVSVGRTGHLLLPLEAGIRQKISYASVGDNVIAATAPYADFTVLQYKKLDVFAGGNVGFAYGNTPFTWTASPEAGARFWMKKDVAVIGRVEFPFNLNDGRFNETIVYSLGFQVKF